jgi:hypothetical protein
VSASAMTKARAEALLSFAGEGAFQRATFWTDNWGVDIEGTNAEIRRDVRESGSGVSLAEAFEAANEFRAYQAARHIINERYIK